MPGHRIKWLKICFSSILYVKRGENWECCNYRARTPVASSPYRVIGVVRMCSRVLTKRFWSYFAVSSDFWCEQMFFCRKYKTFHTHVFMWKHHSRSKTSKFKTFLTSEHQMSATTQDIAAVWASSPAWCLSFGHLFYKAHANSFKVSPGFSPCPAASCSATLPFFSS